MTHHLRVVVQLAMNGAQQAFDIEFGKSFESDVDDVARQVAMLPGSWASTRNIPDTGLAAWEEIGSRLRLTALLNGCKEHGWPFLHYVNARREDDPTTWTIVYAKAYLGWWPNRRAFAEEIGSLVAHFTEGSADFDSATVDEICAGFLCIDIDGQMVAFDLV